MVWLSLVSSKTRRLKSPTAPSLLSRATLSLGMITWASSLVIWEISWATQTKMKVLTKMLSEGFPGIRTKIPLVSAASQMWYWHMNSWGRQSVFNALMHCSPPRSYRISLKKNIAVQLLHLLFYLYSFHLTSKEIFPNQAKNELYIDRT